jgi:hypothetical protein
MTEANMLDALIVRHIADLEAAKRRIEEEVDPRLLREASLLMERRTDSLGWVHEFRPDLGSISVAPEKWIIRNESGNDHVWLAWFEFVSSDADGELVQAWHLAEFLGLEGSSTRKALSFYQNVLKRREWKAILIKNSNAVKALRELGFNIDERDGSINIPVRLDSATLQRGFEENDLDNALKPVREALDLAIRAMPHFDVLAKAVLAASKD